MAGTFTGPDAIFRFLGRLPKETDGTYWSSLIDVLASDERAAALYRAAANATARRLDLDQVLLFRIEDGLVRHVLALPSDPPAFERFWAGMSELRFADGVRYRIEIPSVEGPRRDARGARGGRRRNVPVRRVSQGSGVMMLTDAELTAMAELGRRARRRGLTLPRPARRLGHRRSVVRDLRRRGDGSGRRGHRAVPRGGAPRPRSRDPARSSSATSECSRRSAGCVAPASSRRISC